MTRLVPLHAAHREREPLSRRRRLLLDGGVLLLLAAVFVPMALLRLVDADEGIYLLSAREVMRGLLPYRDFALGWAHGSS